MTGATRDERREATAARILAAAQEEFGELGEAKATIRGIARRAGVDASLVLQHYGSKQSLFALAVAPTATLDPAAASSHLSEVIAARLEHLPAPTRALMRSMLTSDEAAAVMRGYLQERVSVLASTFEGEDADVKAAAIVAGILGITIARHFLELPALADADAEHAASVIAPWLAAMP